MASDVLELQKNEYDCGPASLMVALKLNGIAAKYKEVADIAGTTPEAGTLGEGIVRVLANYGLPAKVWNTKKFKDIAPFLGTRPLILAVDKGNHWVVVFTVYANQVIYFDPYYGAAVQSLTKFKKRWKHSDGFYYAIDAGAV